jgi:hypothetical protein
MKLTVSTVRNISSFGTFMAIGAWCVANRYGKTAGRVKEVGLAIFVIAQFLLKPAGTAGLLLGVGLGNILLVATIPPTAAENSDIRIISTLFRGILFILCEQVALAVAPPRLLQPLVSES